MLTKCNYMLTKCNYMLTKCNYMLTKCNYMLTKAVLSLVEKWSGDISWSRQVDRIREEVD